MKPPPLPRALLSTADAWTLLGFTLVLYVVSQVILTRFSILGGTAVGQVLSFVLPSLLFAKWKHGPIRAALRLQPVPSGIL